MATLVSYAVLFDFNNEMFRILGSNSGRLIRQVFLAAAPLPWQRMNLAERLDLFPEYEAFQLCAVRQLYGTSIRQPATGCFEYMRAMGRSPRRSHRGSIPGPTLLSTLIEIIIPHAISTTVIVC
jgi:hypothetical protein